MGVGEEKAPATPQPGNLPNAEYRRFESMREYEAIIDGLSLEWQATFMPPEADEATILEAEKRRGERYVTDAWNKRI